MLYLMRRLGERIHVVNKNNGDAFEIIISSGKENGYNMPRSYLKVGVSASDDYEILRDDIVHKFLSAPLARSIVSLAYNRKDCNLSYEDLYKYLSKHPKYPKEIGYNDFCQGLQALSIQFDEIKHFVRIELADGYARIFDINYLHVQRRKKEKLNEI